MITSEEWTPADAGENPAIVFYSQGATLSTAPYETIRFEVGISIPCDPSKVFPVLDKLKTAVREEIEKETRHIRKSKLSAPDFEL